MTGPGAPPTRAPLALPRGLAAGCHPVPTLAVTAVSVLLAAGVGLSASRVVLVGAAVLTGQLSIGWSNDRIDAARDVASGREDKPAATGRVPLPALTAAAALALGATVVLSLLLGVRPGAAALVLVAAGWAYNLGLKATAMSGVPYLIGFAALPLVPYLARSQPALPAWWVPAVGGLLGLGAHFANVLPDLGDDEATGVRGLPHRLGRTGSVIAMAVTLAAASVVLGVGPDSSVAFAVVAFAIGVLGAGAIAVAALRAPDTSVAFRLTLALAVVDVALVLTVAL
jgi:4-hydroxybenzoate polyprenyltransferase